MALAYAAPRLTFGNPWLDEQQQAGLVNPNLAMPGPRAQAPSAGAPAPAFGMPAPVAAQNPLSQYLPAQQKPAGGQPTIDIARAVNPAYPGSASTGAPPTAAAGTAGYWGNMGTPGHFSNDPGFTGMNQNGQVTGPVFGAAQPAKPAAGSPNGGAGAREDAYWGGGTATASRPPSGTAQGSQPAASTGGGRAKVGGSYGPNAPAYIGADGQTHLGQDPTNAVMYKEGAAGPGGGAMSTPFADFNQGSLAGSAAGSMPAAGGGMNPLSQYLPASGGAASAAYNPAGMMTNYMSQMGGSMPSAAYQQSGLTPYAQTGGVMDDSFGGIPGAPPGTGGMSPVYSPQSQYAPSRPPPGVAQAPGGNSMGFFYVGDEGNSQPTGGIPGAPPGTGGMPAAPPGVGGLPGGGGYPGGIPGAPPGVGSPLAPPGTGGMPPTPPPSPPPTSSPTTSSPTQQQPTRPTYNPPGSSGYYGPNTYDMGNTQAIFDQAWTNAQANHQGYGGAVAQYNPGQLSPFQQALITQQYGQQQQANAQLGAAQYGMQGQIGAAQAGAQGQIGAAHETSLGNQAVAGTQAGSANYLGQLNQGNVFNTNQSNQNIAQTQAGAQTGVAGIQAGAARDVAGINAGSQNYLGELGLQGQLGVADKNLLGVQDTNRSNQGIAQTQANSQNYLGELGLQGQLGVAGMGLAGVKDTNAANQGIASTQAGAQLGVAGLGLLGTRDTNAAQQAIANTTANASMYGANQQSQSQMYAALAGLLGTQAQADAQRQIAQTNVGPQYSQQALQAAALNALFGGNLGLTGIPGASGTGGGSTSAGGATSNPLSAVLPQLPGIGGVPGTGGGGTVTGSPLPGGVSVTGSLGGGGVSGGGTLAGGGTPSSGLGSQASSPASGGNPLTAFLNPQAPRFDPYHEEQMNAQQASMIARNAAAQKQELMDQYGQAGELPSGAAFNAGLGNINQAALQANMQVPFQSQQAALQYNMNSLPYAQNAWNQNYQQQQLDLQRQALALQSRNPLYNVLGSILG